MRQFTKRVFLLIDILSPVYVGSIILTALLYQVRPCTSSSESFFSFMSSHIIHPPPLRSVSWTPAKNLHLCYSPPQVRLYSSHMSKPLQSSFLCLPLCIHCFCGPSYYFTPDRVLFYYTTHPPKHFHLGYIKLLLHFLHWLCFSFICHSWSYSCFVYSFLYLHTESAIT